MALTHQVHHPRLLHALVHALPPRTASFAAFSLSTPAGVSKPQQRQYSAGMEDGKVCEVAWKVDRQ